jgi:hypothetical protein
VVFDFALTLRWFLLLPLRGKNHKRPTEAGPVKVTGRTRCGRVSQLRNADGDHPTAVYGRLNLINVRNEGTPRLTPIGRYEKLFITAIMHSPQL